MLYQEEKMPNLNWVPIIKVLPSACQDLALALENLLLGI